ncbi:MAG: aminopeptidase P family protein [Candidatus Korarchaeota archaeon NZ13-K]|nr:MAG: aminopeptidase P family protein [Candidatus Korarchaeota archaeon NZ13-K]
MLYISKREIERRISEITDRMSRKGIDALYLVSPSNIAYTTNFFHIPTERPIAALILASGESILFVPRLELEHAERYSYADSVLSYREYPDERHPMSVIVDQMRGLGLEGKRIGFDGDGHGHAYGYRGPRLSELLSASYSYERDLVEDLRMIKSEEEITLLRESAKWAGYAHRLLQEYITVGRIEDEVSLLASMEATLAMAKTLKDIYRPLGWFSGASAGFRGQVGEHSYYPHSLTVHAVIRRGDVLVTGATANVSGYCSELERTLVVGSPSPEQERFFKLMMGARSVALGMVRAGVRCSDVDRAVRKFFEENGLNEHWRHHTGHGIGLDFHEAPFLDVGYERTLEEGMVISVEPGIYVRGLGGFRHSDTILVTSDGFEFITHYPDQLEDLIVEG